MEDLSSLQEKLQQLGYTTDNYTSLHHSCYDKDMIPETRGK